MMITHLDATAEGGALSMKFVWEGKGGFRWAWSEGMNVNNVEGQGGESSGGSQVRITPGFCIHAQH